MDAMQLKIAVCGVGHLGSSFVCGILAAGFPKSSILGVVRDINYTKEKHKELEIEYTTDLKDILMFRGGKIDLIYYSTPTRIAKQYLTDNARILYECNSILVNNCAGVTCSKVIEWLKEGLEKAGMVAQARSWEPKVCSLNPSVAMSVMEGVGTCYLKHLEEKDVEVFNKIISLVLNNIIVVDTEKEIQDHCCTTGCFPGTAPHMVIQVNKQFQEAGYNPEPLKDIITSIFLSIGNFYKMDSATETPNKALKTPLPKDLEEKVVKKAVDPESVWNTIIKTAVYMTVARYALVTQLL